MERRDLLRATGAAGFAGLAGCIGMFEAESNETSGSSDGETTASDGETTAEPTIARNTTVADRAQGVYYPTHIDGTKMVGTGGSGRYRVGLMYTVPHAFWTVTGRDTNRVRFGEDAVAHLMATIWDAKTRTVLPTANVSVELRKGGKTVDSRDLWPMLSQNMGYHFGDNVPLPDYGTYTAKLDVGAMQARRMGDLRGAFGGRTALEVEFEHTREKIANISYERLPDKKGTAGAIAPMESKMPLSRVPKPADLPGRTLGRGETGDATFVAFVPEKTPRFVAGGKTYLAVSPRTPYNRYPLPFMSLSAALQRGGESVYDDILRPALDPNLGYHYGAAVDGVKSGDALTVTVDAPPQVARHEGYETAFLEMSKVELTVA
ncbi:MULTISPECIES: iron transporter [Halorussus]|uniref:iron transporter n=1 Tax=Halorussus TaxID=1070314 RepID=UPI0020A1C375|nr:iron transporter [Halorussus vallis]USZ78109.1 iron transporter [Halorussus vallis]